MSYSEGQWVAFSYARGGYFLPTKGGGIMAIVQGTGWAEEVYYGVDLAFRHLLKPVEKRLQQKPKVEDGPSSASGNSRVDLPDLQVPIDSCGITRGERAIVWVSLFVASQMGLTIDPVTKSVSPNGPWKIHHGLRVRTDEEGFPFAYMVVAKPSFDGQVGEVALVKATTHSLDPLVTMVPMRKLCFFSIAGVEEYNKATPITCTEEEKGKLAALFRFKESIIRSIVGGSSR